MLKIGVQTQNAVSDDCPAEGFKMIREAGFDCVDFSLHGYLLNTDLYQGELNDFFDKSVNELEEYFKPHKIGAKNAGITIHQMHMPYPMYVPTENEDFNNYLSEIVAPKSLQICSFLECKYIVIHGFKLTRFLGSEEEEWSQTEIFLDKLAPIARECGITICIENLYNNVAGNLVEGPCCNARKAVERIDRMNEKYKTEVLGFCFDTGHANLVGLNFECFLTTLGDRLKVLHIHDNDGVRDLHQVPFTFTKVRENTASTDWQSFIAGLKNIKFNKVLNFETSPVLKSFPESMKGDALEFIAKIGRYFAKSISTN